MPKDMRRIIFVLVLMVMALYSGAKTQIVNEEISLQVRFDDPTNGHEPFSKSPITVPTISLDDHTLYLDTPCDGCTLNIVDGSGVVVYTTVIPTGTTSLVLPATLSGEYELQIISGNYLFHGTIDLP